MESTNNFLNWVEIKNFKSIKDLRLDCKRVNIFIGKPNVGKSNILEALGLLSLIPNSEKMFDGYIRYKTLRDVFYDTDISQAVSVKSNFISTFLSQKGSLESSDINFNYTINHPGNNYLLNAQGKTEAVVFLDLPTRAVKKYNFFYYEQFRGISQEFLIPPHGVNLYSIIKKNIHLWEEFATLFKEQDLEFVLSEAEQTFVLQKKEGHRVWQYPYYSIADTFQRFMFYLTAIESNKNSILILEEPEVHSFPPYVQTLAFRMIESETNQFFVSTHSPYLLQTLIEHLKDDQLNVFITYYEDYQTKVRALTPDELSEVQEYSIDIFYNLRRFIPPVNA